MEIPEGKDVYTIDSNARETKESLAKND